MMEFHAEIEMPEQKVGRGGAREGAGRKRKDVHYYGFRACQRGTRHPFLSVLGDDSKGMSFSCCFI